MEQSQKFLSTSGKLAASRNHKYAKIICSLKSQYYTTLLLKTLLQILIFENSKWWTNERWLNIQSNGVEFKLTPKYLQSEGQDILPMVTHKTELWADLGKCWTHYVDQCKKMPWKCCCYSVTCYNYRGNQNWEISVGSAPCLYCIGTRMYHDLLEIRRQLSQQMISNNNNNNNS